MPFHFTESGIENTTVVSQGILEYSIPCEDVEEGTVRVEEEWYEKTMLLALDEGDTTTTTESTNCSRRRRCAWDGWNTNPKVDKV